MTCYQDVLEPHAHALQLKYSVSNRSKASPSEALTVSRPSMAHLLRVLQHWTSQEKMQAEEKTG